MDKKTLRYFSNQMNFEAIHKTIENRNVQPTDYFRKLANSGKRFFNDALKGIESLTQEEYYLVENLEEIADAFGYEKINKENVEEIASSIKNAITSLDKLEKNQEDFYNSKQSEELSKICKNLADFYSFIYEKGYDSSLDGDD